MKNFIGIYDSFVSKELCDKIIDFFEESPNKCEGRLHRPGMITVDKEAKDSTDLLCNIHNVPFKKEMIRASEITTQLYIADFPECNNGLSPWEFDIEFNIQRYLPNQGYFAPHCESGSLRTNHRVLAWMIYLNDVDDGGETRWISYDLNVKPKKGRVVIWPAFFTHIHHGLVSETETKYIATGWYNYKD